MTIDVEVTIKLIIEDIMNGGEFDIDSDSLWAEVEDVIDSEGLDSIIENGDYDIVEVLPIH